MILSKGCHSIWLPCTVLNLSKVNVIDKERTILLDLSLDVSGWTFGPGPYKEVP